jgi:hypothetical protein
MRVNIRAYAYIVNRCRVCFLAVNRDPGASTWRQWLSTARSIDPNLKVDKAWDLSFREELHAIDAVVAGQGTARPQRALDGICRCIAYDIENMKGFDQSHLIHEKHAP